MTWHTLPFLGLSFLICRREARFPVSHRLGHSFYKSTVVTSGNGFHSAPLTIPGPVLPKPLHLSADQGSFCDPIITLLGQYPCFPGGIPAFWGLQDPQGRRRDC